MVFNQPLLQGIFPENCKVSKVTPIDKMVRRWSHLIIDLYLHYPH